MRPAQSTDILIFLLPFIVGVPGYYLMRPDPPAPPIEQPAAPALDFGTFGGAVQNYNEEYKRIAQEKKSSTMNVFGQRAPARP